jgi:hypothetical protein
MVPAAEAAQTIEPQLHHLPQLNPMVPAAEAAQTMVGAGAQPSRADYEQGQEYDC